MLPAADLKYTAAEVLRGRWWLVPVALGASLVATPIVRAIAHRLKVLDLPDDFLKPHGRPVPYLGGLAICFGLLVGLGGYVAGMPALAAQWASLRGDLAALRLDHLAANPLWKVLAIALASVVITVVGLLDDLYDLPARKRIWGHLAAGLILLVGGVGHRMAEVLNLPGIGGLPEWLVLPTSAVLCLLAVVLCCNATNLLDGLDGLCGGVTGIISLGFLALGVWLAMWGRYPDTDELRVALCLAMAGAVFGFLPYNVPPATIFMGDAGSRLLGFFVAAMMALFCREGSARWFVAACAVYALPILDTSLAVVRRVRQGRSIFLGDRSHLYDQLVDRGLTVRQVVLLFYLLATLAAVGGVGLAILVRLRYALVVYAAALAIVWLVFWRKGMVAPEPRAEDG